MWVQVDIYTCVRKLEDIGQYAYCMIRHSIKMMTGLWARPYRDM
jgi:hypothetical protein